MLPYRRPSSYSLLSFLLFLSSSFSKDSPLIRPILLQIRSFQFFPISNPLDEL